MTGGADVVSCMWCALRALGNSVEYARRAVICNYSPLRGNRRLSQFVEQRPGFFQIGGVEAFGEPAVDRGEKIAGLTTLALIAPQPGEARRRAQFPGLCLLRAGNGDGSLEMRLRLRRVGLGRQQRDFPGGSVDLGLAPLFLGCFRRCHRFAEAAPSRLELAEFRMGACQMRQIEWHVLS